MRAHKNHRFTSMHIALPNMRGKMQRALDILRGRLTGLNKSKDQFTTAAAHVRAQAQHTEMQIQAQFRRLHQFLQDEEAARLQAVREEESKKTQNIADKIAAITDNITTLTDTIRATEELLKASDSLFPLEYKETVDKASRCVLMNVPNLGAKALLDQAKHVGNMAFHVWNNMKKVVQFSPVILDPNTAHPDLMMSEDLCSVGQTRKLHLPQNPERFFYYTRVQGWEGWSQGGHSWIVQVPDDSYWVIGVVRESVLGKGLIVSGFWEIVVMNGKYKACAGYGTCKELNIKKKVEKVRVKLNFDTGRLSFYYAGTRKLIHRFTYAFQEKLFPYVETHNNVKLKILPVPKIDLNIEKQ
ncbi:zinc-binding protein A33-like [Periophthalmus magnuspinnatus]|uniref:zinc-binding protein A33-like n=1 Tax=Periophthalmus magnuspinnatus TaxID=409849 RepID=UPI0024368C55|nr:zinc-binding protein A33-like [Periophthalmus magnuspinnatus]